MAQLNQVAGIPGGRMTTIDKVDAVSNLGIFRCLRHILCLAIAHG